MNFSKNCSDRSSIGRKRASQNYAKDFSPRKRELFWNCLEYDIAIPMNVRGFIFFISFMYHESLLTQTETSLYGGVENVHPHNRLLHSQKSHSNSRKMRYHFLILCLILWATSVPGYAVFKLSEIEMSQQQQIVAGDTDFRKLLSEQYFLTGRLVSRQEKRSLIP